jgi:hypothetical protein
MIPTSDDIFDPAAPGGLAVCYGGVIVGCVVAHEVAILPSTPMPLLTGEYRTQREAVRANPTPRRDGFAQS